VFLRHPNIFALSLRFQFSANVTSSSYNIKCPSLPLPSPLSLNSTTFIHNISVKNFRLLSVPYQRWSHIATFRLVQAETGISFCVFAADRFLLRYRINRVYGVIIA